MTDSVMLMVKCRNMKKCIYFFLTVFCFSIVNAQQQTDTLTVYFDIDKSIVDISNAEHLDELINNKNVVSISIYGYTDFLGNRQYNRQLSEKRSVNVQNYLLSKGISKENIAVVTGKGVHPNSIEENRKDLSDKGIQEHRIVHIVYTTNTQNDKPSDEIIAEIPMTEISIVEIQPETNENKLTEENLVVNNHIVLENILFYNNSDVFRSVSYPALEELLMFMRQHRTLKIEIHGHVCCQSDDMQEVYIEDKPISLSRAKAVYDYLVRNGINPTRLNYIGFGSTRKRFPLEQNEYERDMNRRVEIFILEF